MTGHGDDKNDNELAVMKDWQRGEFPPFPASMPEVKFVVILRFSMMTDRQK